MLYFTRENAYLQASFQMLHEFLKWKCHAKYKFLGFCRTSLGKKNERLYGLVKARHLSFVEFSTLSWVNEHIVLLLSGYER